jgi:hypothetical protein
MQLFFLAQVQGITYVMLLLKSNAGTYPFDLKTEKTKLIVLNADMK